MLIKVSLLPWTNICVWLKVSNFIFSTVGIGPRLTSLLVEITESGDLKTEDIVRFVTSKLLWLIHTELERDRGKIVCKILCGSFHTTASAQTCTCTDTLALDRPQSWSCWSSVWIKARSYDAIATAICNGSHGIQCKCSQGTIMTVTLDLMQPIIRNRVNSL